MGYFRRGSASWMEIAMGRASREAQHGTMKQASKCTRTRPVGGHHRVAVHDGGGERRLRLCRLCMRACMNECQTMRMRVRGDWLSVWCRAVRQETNRLLRTTTSSASTQPAAWARGTRKVSRGRACSNTMQRASSTAVGCGLMGVSGRMVCGGSIWYGTGGNGRGAARARNLWPRASDTHFHYQAKPSRSNPPHRRGQDSTDRTDFDALGSSMYMRTRSNASSP